MKVLIASIFSMLPIFLFAQGLEKFYEVLPMKDSVITYTDVVKVNSVTSDRLFTRGRKWFSETYNSSKDVIQFSDKEAGEIMGRGFFETYCSDMV